MKGSEIFVFTPFYPLSFNPLMGILKSLSNGDWLLMGGLLHFGTGGGAWSCDGPAQSHPRGTKYIHLYSP